MDANHRPTAYRLTIRRRVSDIDDWRQTIERRAPQLRSAGVIGYSLSRVVDDHSETELVLEFDDRDQAEAMAGRLDLPESRENVLQAGAMGKGGEVLLLDMGEQVRIVDLARQLIRMSGLREGEDIEIVLASRRTRRGDLAWGLAKGGIEPGESREDAAVREVREETGLDATIEADLGDTKYIYVWEDVRIRKRVHFFLMRHVGGDVDDRDDEMEEIRWFPLERALKRAAYRGEREVLARAAELLQ